MAAPLLPHVPAVTSLQRLALVLSTAACLAACAAPAGAAQTLTLDLSNAANADPNPVNAPTSSAPLDAGQQYIVTVQGTGSIWPSSAFKSHGTWGVAEDTMYPAGSTDPAGWDAATVFAAPLGASVSPFGPAGPSLPLPISSIAPGANGKRPTAGFEFTDGGTYARPVPIGGAVSSPNPAHVYSWAVTGSGAPLHFRFSDSPATDDSGQFHIAICAAAEAASGVCAPPAAAGGGAGGAPSIITAPKLATASPTSVKLAGTRTCKAAPTISVRLTEPKGVQFAKATYLFNGKKKRVLYRATSRTSRLLIYTKGGKTGQIRSQSYTGLGRAKIKMRIEVLTTKNQTFSVKRTIQACTKTGKTLHFK
jgi:hypothetical protein